MIASFRGAVARWLTISLVADVYASAPHPVSSRNTSDLPPGLVERLLVRPDVDGGTTYRGFETTDAQGRLVFGAALGMDPRSRFGFAFVSGSVPQVWERFEAGDAIVSEPFARRRGVGLGDTVELRTDRGLERFAVAGVYYDYTSDQGFVQISRRTYERLFDDRGVSSLGLFLLPEADPQATAEDVRARLRPGEVPRVRSNASLRAASLEVFDRTFRVTSVLRLLAGAIAFVGTLSALLALQMEREREIGVLRAIGLTPRQVRRLVLSETGRMGAIAGLIALPLGAGLAWTSIEHINTRAFGWSLWLQLPASLLAQALGLAVLVALLAGLAPAWRMARISPARALKERAMQRLLAPALVALAACSPQPAAPRTPRRSARCSADAPAEGFERALAPRAFVFPADHGPHPGFRAEWWYFTGNLATDAGLALRLPVDLLPHGALRPPRRPGPRPRPWATPPRSGWRTSR